jgi:hypothetical protein
MKNVRTSLPCGVRFEWDHCLKRHVQNKKLRSSLDGFFEKSENIGDNTQSWKHYCWSGIENSQLSTTRVHH